MMGHHGHEPREAHQQIPEELPILPSGDAIVFPSMVAPMASDNPMTVQIIDYAAANDKMVGIFAQRPSAEEPGPTNLYSIGTAAVIARMFKLPDGSIRALLQGLERIRLKEVTQKEPFVKGKVEVLPETEEKGTELEALAHNMKGLFQKAVSLSPNLPNEIAQAAQNMTEPGALADFIAAHINLTLEERQQILETLDVGERLKRITALINRELELLELGSKIQSQIKGEMEKGQREYYLREQLKAIQKELGELDERSVEINELKVKIEEAGLPEVARKEAERELERLTKMSPQAAEYSVSRTYLDWLITLPWNKNTQDGMDVAQAARILDEDHYNLEKPKQRILEYLAVRQLKKGEMRGPILCFVGPPGTGKTSLGQSIARAMGRKFVRLSLGGIRDEAEIRGHRRTYVGALPGRIIQSMRRAESNNPVFMLDEVDKIGADFRGDPAAALLEVLDPEQNFAFSDHYLDVPFDLSQVLFITTANLADPIPPALRDRMETLELPGYTELEKLHIARKYLIPRQLKENGLTAESLEFADEAVLAIIRSYTREAGVRNLEREIGSVCRKVASRLAQGKKGKVAVAVQDMAEYLGPPQFRYEMAGEADEVGVATGLAWTPVGGDVLFVEAAVMPGKGSLIITGKLGDVMQESARAALTYIRSQVGDNKLMPTALNKIRLNLGEGARGNKLGPSPFDNVDIHIHVPAGAIPKDGPSAGVTMAVALASALTRRPVSKKLAMTGEITLRGKVLPVGGIKDKVLAAHRAGIRKVALPKENEKDLAEVPEHVRRDLQFLLVEHADEVLGAALESAEKEPASAVR